MDTPLQSKILKAIKQADPRPLTDVDIWAATGGYESGGHGAACLVACLILADAGLIVTDGQSRWKLHSGLSRAQQRESDLSPKARIAEGLEIRAKNQRIWDSLTPEQRKELTYIEEEQ